MFRKVGYCSLQSNYIKQMHLFHYCELVTLVKCFNVLIPAIVKYSMSLLVCCIPWGLENEWNTKTS